MMFNQYQLEARKTAIYPNVGNNICYPTLGLCGEAGEVAEKVKKLIRDKDGILTGKFLLDIAKELGDVLWYIANLCSELGLDMGEIAVANLNKLQARKDQNLLHGDGDDREVKTLSISSQVKLMEGKE